MNFFENLMSFVKLYKYANCINSEDKNPSPLWVKHTFTHNIFSTKKLIQKNLSEIYPCMDFDADVKFAQVHNSKPQTVVKRLIYSFMANDIYVHAISHVSTKTWLGAHDQM